MLPITQAVWRHLLVEARRGRRHWPSLAPLAAELDLGVSTVHKALREPVEIGCVGVSRRLGVQVLDPYRLLILFAANRRLSRDVVSRRLVAAVPARSLERRAVAAGLIVGGIGALVSHLRDNRISDYTVAVVYGDARYGEDLDVATPDQVATELLVLQADARLVRYGPVVPIAQAYADVFCLPGWQSARFIEQVDPWTVASYDERVLVA